MQQQVDDPPSLPVGTEVSAKYKGAFCEAKVRKVVRNIKVKVGYKQGLGSGIVSDDAIKSGVLRVGAVVEVKHPDKREFVEATITKIQDCSQYTVVFDDGDITTLRRTALCLKSGRHFNESETLDQLPLTHPEHFGNPVIGGRRGRRSRHLQEESSDDEDENESKEIVNEKEEHIGKIVCVESTETKKKDKEKWFPGLVVAPTAQVTVRIRVKDEYLVRSFKDGRYYTVPKKEATEFTRELAAKQDSLAVQAALEYLDNDVLPPHWDREALFSLTNSSSEYEGEVDSDSSDDEPREEKDHFVAQLYKYMDDRGTPLNKVPSITNRDVDLYRLFRTVQKLGGYNRVTSQNQWKPITMRLGFTPVTVSVTNLVKQAYKKFLQPFEEFNRKLGCSMSMTPRNASRSKGRSLVRANSVASPKPEIKETKEQKQIQVVEESENTSESSSMDVAKSKRKLSTGSNKVKALVEKFEEKSKDESEASQPTVISGKSAKQNTKDDTGQTQISITLTGTRKEKVGAKKNASGTEEKRGRKKKEVVEAEKQAEKVVEPFAPIADFPVEVGDKLKVYYHEKKVTYEAKVIDLSIHQGTPLYLVHYTGWNTRYDEWVPKERIAENLSNSKAKRLKGGSANANNQQKAAGGNLTVNEGLKSATNDKSSTQILPVTTPKSGMASKRGRGRSDSQPPRSTTPSLAPNSISSRTKSPAVAAIQRRITRAQPNAAISRRTSNNISDISMQTDSDTDSDEPVKKPTKSTTSSNASGGSTSSTQATAGSVKATTDDTKSASSTAVNSPSETEEDDVPLGAVSAKGRDYDLNQIRSELKGINELKSPSPEGDTMTASQLTTTTTTTATTTGDKNQSSVFNFSGVMSNSDLKPTQTTSKSSPTTTNTAVDLKSSSTDLSSETDSFADDDSQSSDKTTTLENMTEKLQQKIKAEKLAQAKCLERINASGGKTVEKITPLKSAGIEKIIKDSLVEKMQETLKATVKPFLIEKSVYKSSASASVITVEKDEKPKPIVEIKVQSSGTKQNVTKSSSLPTVVMPEKKIITSLIEAKALPTSRGVEGRKIGSLIEKSPQITIKATQKDTTHIAGTETISSNTSNQHSSQITQSILHEKSLKDIPKPSMSSIKSQQPPTFSGVTAAAAAADVYEFKEPEPFEFEGRKPPISTAHSSSEITESKKKKNSQKVEHHEVNANKNLSSLVTPTTTAGRKNKKSPLKDIQSLSDIRTSKQIKIEEKLQVTETISSSSSSISTSTTAASTVPTNSTSATKSATNIKKPENPFDVLRKSPSFNLNINALNEELATTLQETAKALPDIPAERIIPVTLPTPTAQKVIPTFISPFVESKVYHADVANVFEMKSDDESSTKGDQSNDKSSSKKTEFETVKKILLSDATFDLEPPKIEKPSIADKVLKALNQQKQDEKTKETLPPPLPSSLSLSTSASSSALITPKLSESVSRLELSSSSSSSVHLELPQISSFIISSEPPKIELPAIIKKEIEMPSINKKPILSSPEHKLDILESIAPKNNDLSETIQKLESVIQKTSNVDHFDEDSSDSTDSERRLIIEDDSHDSDNQNEISKILITTSSPTPSVIATTITTSTTTSTSITATLPIVSTTVINNENKLLIKEEKPPNIIIPQTVLVTATTTAGAAAATVIKQELPLKLDDIQNKQNFATKFQSSIFGMKSIVFSDSSILSDAGIKPIIDTSPIKMNESNISNEQNKIAITKTELITTGEQVLINTSPSASSTSSSFLTSSAIPTTSIIISNINSSLKDEPTSNIENLNIHSDSINLLLCEETIPGSPTPIRDTINIDIKPNIHPIEADIKPIPMDIECSPIPCSSTINNTDLTIITSATTGTTIAMPLTTLSSLRQSNQKNTANVVGTRTIGVVGDNQTPGSSPRDSVSQDDSSEDLKKQIEQDNDLTKIKRRRTRKHSDCESSSFTSKRRRGTTITSGNVTTITTTTNNNNNSTKRNGSDSEDNSDANVSQKTSIRPTRPCQYNFLVQLDPALNPNQRISILRKKIQELRKTYNLIKAELASIDRRRKKLRRREREKKNLQKVST